MKARFERSTTLLLVCAALGLARAALGAPPFAIDSPAATVATLHQGLIDASTKSPDASVEERYRLLEPLIEATHDLPYIGEFALRKQWPSLSAEERARFLKAFERLSVMTYASRFSKVSAQTFKPAAQPKITGERAQVTATIARQGGAADVSLEYLLQHEADGWRIINIVADGVSDLALKRAEYQRILATGSLDTLIAELEQQTARLAAQ